uniref:Tyrosine-protein phosphatase domain-containing protein n=1 Tax=Panagrolaimus davidi TaxID=227884 RepID=A0A914PQA1_9BILA
MVEMVCHRLLVKNEMEIRMPQIAIDLRHQRMGSVQTDIQYIFVYRCVLEILVGENALPKSPEVTKFIESYESLIDRKKKDLKKKQK